EQAERHPRVRRSAARVDRFPRQRALGGARRVLHQGDGRRLREGARVVRQRVGLFEPVRRPGPPHRQERALMQGTVTAKRSIKDLDVKGRRVLIRVDFNVPIKNGTITDDTRIRASLPTIKYAIEHGARAVILCSHLGRPKGKPNHEYSLKPGATALLKMLIRPVSFATVY